MFGDVGPIRRIRAWITTDEVPRDDGPQALKAGSVLFCHISEHHLTRFEQAAGRPRDLTTIRVEERAQIWVVVVGYSVRSGKPGKRGMGDNVKRAPRISLSDCGDRWKREDKIPEGSPPQDGHLRHLCHLGVPCQIEVRTLFSSVRVCMNSRTRR